MMKIKKAFNILLIFTLIIVVFLSSNLAYPSDRSYLRVPVNKIAKERTDYILYEAFLKTKVERHLTPEEAIEYLEDERSDKVLVLNKQDRKAWFYPKEKVNRDSIESGKLKILKLKKGKEFKGRNYVLVFEEKTSSDTLYIEVTKRTGPPVLTPNEKSEILKRAKIESLSGERLLDRDIGVIEGISEWKRERELPNLVELLRGSIENIRDKETRDSLLYEFSESEDILREFEDPSILFIRVLELIKDCEILSVDLPIEDLRKFVKKPDQHEIAWMVEEGGKNKLYILKGPEGLELLEFLRKEKVTLIAALLGHEGLDELLVKRGVNRVLSHRLSELFERYLLNTELGKLDEELKAEKSLLDVALSKWAEAVLKREEEVTEAKLEKVEEVIASKAAEEFISLLIDNKSILPVHSNILHWVSKNRGISNKELAERILSDEKEVLEEGELKRKQEEIELLVEGKVDGRDIRGTVRALREEFEGLKNILRDIQLAPPGTRLKVKDIRDINSRLARLKSRSKFTDNDILFTSHLFEIIARIVGDTELSNKLNAILKDIYYIVTVAKQDTKVVSELLDDIETVLRFFDKLGGGLKDSVHTYLIEELVRLKTGISISIIVDEDVTNIALWAGIEKETVSHYHNFFNRLRSNPTLQETYDALSKLDRPSEKELAKELDISQPSAHYRLVKLRNLFEEFGFSAPMTKGIRKDHKKLSGQAREKKLQRLMEQVNRDLPRLTTTLKSYKPTHLQNTRHLDKILESNLFAQMGVDPSISDRNSLSFRYKKAVRALRIGKGKMASSNQKEQKRLLDVALVILVNPELRRLYQELYPAHFHNVKHPVDRQQLASNINIQQDKKGSIGVSSEIKIIPVFFDGRNLFQRGGLNKAEAEIIERKIIESKIKPNERAVIVVPGINRAQKNALKRAIEPEFIVLSLKAKDMGYKVRNEFKAILRIPELQERGFLRLTPDILKDYQDAKKYLDKV